MKAKDENKRKDKRFPAGLLLVLGAAAVVFLCLSGMLKKEMIVGKDIKIEDISDFYFTWSGSSYPPDFQRYRFYAEDGKHYFYHETREGDHWPLTEDDVTVSGTKELTEEEWTRFFELLQGSSVRKREDSGESGSNGPWLYLYWKGDRSKYQELSFPSWESRDVFEAYCIQLKETQD